MKRFFFTVIVLAAVATGCTKSNLVELPQTFETPIAFEPYAGKAPMTKASVMTADVLKTYQSKETSAFHVTAFIPGEYTKPYMDKNVWYVPETTGETNVPASWKYDGKAYWPESKLQFIAYGLNAQKPLPTGASTSTIQFEEGSFSSFSYTVSDLVSDQEDLIVADSLERSSMNGATVNLTFKHLLSKIGFSLQTNQENDVMVTIKKVELKGNFYDSGTVNMLAKGDDLKVVPTGTASLKAYSLFGELDEDDNTVVSYDPNATESASYDCFQSISCGPETSVPMYANKTLELTVADGVKDEDINDKTGADENNRYMMLIPCTPATATIEVIYQLTDADEQKAKVELPADFNFEKGKGYEFVLKISTMSVEFDVTVSDWDDATNIEDSYTLTPVVE